MAGNPFLLRGPPVISFSGGRTSGYLLWRVLKAHRGVLPADVLVCFANTGREMGGTLDFVRDCGAAWSVPIHWLEYRHEPGRYVCVEVSHNSASRDGEPFEALVRAKASLPNPTQRFCTEELKVGTIARFLRALGWLHWTNAVGLRADEPKRVTKAMHDGRKKPRRWSNVCPLAVAGVTEADVFAFWRSQPFDLRLAGPHEGNCDGCYLKGRGALERMLLDHPARMAWWAKMEALRLGPRGRRFHPPSDRDSYAAMARMVRDQGRLDLTFSETFGPCENGGCGA